MQTENIINFLKNKKFIFSLISGILIIGLFLYYNENSQTSAAGMLKDADNLVKNGKIAYALEDYNKIVRIFPRNYEAHIRTAELYLMANEPEQAKVEYLQAIKLGYKTEYAANIAMANIYAKENNYRLAENYIDQIKFMRDKHVQELIGDFYYNRALSDKTSDKPEAVRQFKAAYPYYKKSGSKKLLQLKKEIRDIYIDISNELLNENKLAEASDILKISLKFWNNAETHYVAAKICEKQGQIDNALSEYKTAFKLNTAVGKNEGYVQLLVKKAEIAKAKGDKVSTELYYTLARKIDSKINIQINPDNKIILNILSAKGNEDFDKDVLMPEISLKLMNISKDKIKNLKIKIVFLENKLPFSKVIKVIASDKTPLNNDSGTSQINIFSPEPVKYVFEKHNLQVQIYISQKNPDEWVLFRNLKILTKKESDVIIQGN